MSFDEGLAVGLALGKKKFSGGVGGDKWTYPADWIQIPQPASNEIYCVGAVSLNTYRGANIDFGMYGGDNSAVIDWGDGVTTVPTSRSSSHNYSADTIGHLTDSGMEQFLIKITLSNPANWGGANFADSEFALAVAFGADTLMGNNVGAIHTLHQIQLPNVTTLSGCLSGHYALKKIITPTKLTALGTSALSQCFSLEDIDLSEVISVGEYAIDYWQNIKKLNLPKVATIAANGIAFNYSLREINAPLLTSVGDYGLSENYSLAKITYAEGCVFGNGAFDSNYNLYPIPTT